MRPKRQAPPPPAARAASVDCTEDRTCRVPPQGAEVRMHHPELYPLSDYAYLVVY